MYESFCSIAKNSTSRCCIVVIEALLARFTTRIFTLIAAALIASITRWRVGKINYTEAIKGGERFAYCQNTGNFPATAPVSWNYLQFTSALAMQIVI
jgi:hypothetical protein